MAKSITPTRILVLTKYRFIGDTLLAVPLLRAIKQEWPDSDLTLLTGGLACELLRGCPLVDTFIEFDPYRKQDEGWSRLFQIINQVRQGKFDIALICNRSFHSALIAFAAGIPNRIGWSGFQGRDWMLTQTTEYQGDDPEQKSYLDLLSAFTTNQYHNTDLQLWVSDSEIESMRGKFKSSATPLIGIQPGASHSEKQWTSEGYADVVHAISGKYPLAGIVLIGGPDEASEADALLALLDPKLRSGVINLVGNLSLRRTVAALTFLDLFIGGDTAIRHCAAAVNVPSIALFGPTSVKKWGNANPPQRFALSAESSKVADVPPEQVVVAALEILDKSACKVAESSLH